MSENSKIEWCDHTFNPWEGCTKASSGCANCYAETRNARWNGGTAPNWGKGALRRRTSESNWKKPVKWNREAGNNAAIASQFASIGNITYQRPRVFCASLADWLDDEVPIEWLADLLDLIRRTPNIDWLLLSKRLENWPSRIGMAARHIHATGGEMSMMCAWSRGDPPSNVWMGATAENQDMACTRIHQLLAIPARMRFLSCEPLLGHLDITGALSRGGPPLTITDSQGIDWLICGGESGPNARPMHPDWARSLRDQCASTGVPFFMKQMGGTKKPFAPIPDDLFTREFPK